MKPFDEPLFTLKVQELSDRMHRQTATRLHQADAEQKAIGQGRGTGWLVKRVDAAMGVFREFVPEIEKACRETWLSDHDSITPEFIRGELVPRVFTFVAARKGAIHGDLELLASRVGLGTELTPVLHHLVHETNRLQTSLATRYEIEALELAKQAARMKPPEHPRGSAPPPITMVNTSRGLWLDSSSKPTEIPHDPPTYFPSDLWPQTYVILLEGQRKFPLRTQTLELCKHITSEMTPLFCEAVKAGRMKGSKVLREGLGGMEDLLRFLLVHNDDGPKSGFSSLSDQAYQLGQKVRKSDEWLALSKAVTDSHLASRTAGDHLREGANQAEFPGAQKSAPTSGQTSKSTSRGAAIGPNIDRLRKECGWSFERLASETGIDKKSVLSHVNKGVRPIPRILAEYAQAFSKKLERKITAPELET